MCIRNVWGLLGVHPVSIVVRVIAAEYLLGLLEQILAVKERDGPFDGRVFWHGVAEGITPSGPFGESDGDQLPEII